MMTMMTNIDILILFKKIILSLGMLGLSQRVARSAQ